MRAREAAGHSPRALQAADGLEFDPLVEFVQGIAERS